MTLSGDAHVNPHKRPGTTLNLSQYGHFEGNEFVFDPPLRTPDGRTMHRMDMAGAMLDGDMSPHEVIVALLYPLPPGTLTHLQQVARVTHTSEGEYPEEHVAGYDQRDS